MSSQTFTPSDVVDMDKEKDWAANIGMMDWDTTKIVFTKRSLIEFLKYTGTTVDTNFSNIAKLPKYAKFGRISGDASADSGTANSRSEASATKDEPTFRSSGRERTGPGGPTTNIFEEEFADDALSQAPPKQKASMTGTEAPIALAAATIGNTDELMQPSGVRPSRRVRTAPGGKDSLAEVLWGDSDNTEFKPTRKVRQRPGGEDSVASILG